jgi:hypothetical protein
MKKILLIIAVIIIANSCIKETPEIYGYYTITNQYENEIELKLFNNGIYSDSLNIATDENIEYTFYDKAGIPQPPPFIADSLLVIFNDSVSVMHYRNEEQLVERSLLLDESWTELNVNEYEYRFDYVFSEDDYLEAVEILLGN